MDWDTADRDDQPTIDSRPTDYDGVVSPILSHARNLDRIIRESANLNAVDTHAAITDIETLISETPANSLSEAAIQLMLASAFVECLRADDGLDMPGLLEKAERLIRSAFKVVAQEAPIDMAEFSAEFYTPARTDPFLKDRRFN